jgi:Peptidase C1-like family
MMKMARGRPSDADGAYVLVAPSRTHGSQTVSISTAEEWEKEVMQDSKVGQYKLLLMACIDGPILQNRLALTALSKNQLNDVVYQANALQTDKQLFNVKIPFEGAPVTNQRSSGRCWIFAATNVFRVAIMKKHNLSSFELSQAYLFFWDKLEKANWFLEQIVDTAGDDLDGRLVQTLLRDPVGDGGQWDMLSNLVSKYGLVSHPPNCV